MSRQIEEIPLVSLNLNFTSDIPLYKQLYELIRNAILEGKFSKGQRLPGTRSLSAELKISRNTVALAFEQLLIEGYINGKIGSGTFVSEIPDNFFEPANRKSRFEPKANLSRPYWEQTLIEKTKSTVSKQILKKDLKKAQILTLIEKLSKQSGSNELINRYTTKDEVIPFQNGIPAFNEFPIKVWQKLINQTAQDFSNLQLGYGEAAGFKPLREAIASYLRTYRAVNCIADQIIIINGTQQGLDLIGRVLLKPGSIVWLEDPGYFGARAAMIFAGAEIFPTPLDSEGLDLDYASQNNPKPDLIFTTPSHQFPLGLTMSISRRLNLLKYALQNKCWIIEDDYDSEFRYSGSPFPSLQGLDQNGKVLYLGTFSKVLFPGLRLGYLVLPDSGILDEFILAKSLIDRQSPIFEQIVLSKFIEEGYFTRHLRKMRLLYKARQEFLIGEINKEFKGMINAELDPAGMHIIAWLTKKKNDKKIAEEALKNNIIVRPLSEYSIKFFKKPGLIMGYTAFEKSQIKKGLLELKKTLLL
jgi:GntR family transcriptional regulator/MocR family aminotransferase